MPSHRPVVGSALNWQGQPQLQLQLTTCSPAIRHLILAASLIFLLLYHVPPNRGMPHSGWVTEAIRTAICSALVLHIARLSPGILRSLTTAREGAFGLVTQVIPLYRQVSITKRTVAIRGQVTSPSEGGVMFKACK